MSKETTFGLLGEKIGHSFSPLMFNNYFRKLNLNYKYVLFPMNSELIPQWLQEMRTSDILGINVTIPHKKVALNYLDDIDEEARKIGSINVIHNNNGKLIGYNTDHPGFLRALEPYRYSKINSAVVLGAGGAARAIIYSLHSLALEKINFFSRSNDKLEKICHDFSFISNLRGYLWNNDKIKEEIQQVDILINATPVGMNPNEENAPIDIDFPLKENFIVFDLIYNPELTKLSENAKSKGAIIENGLKMLIYQALESIKIWINEKINEEIFIKSAQEVLNASISKRR